MEGDERDREVLAEWDRRCRLVRAGDIDGGQHFVVELLDDAGDVAASARYAHEHFPLAAEDYNSRIADTFDPSARPAARVVLQTISALAGGDLEALEGLFHDDYVHVDHRPIGYPEVDKTGMIEWQVAQSVMPTVWLPQTIEAVTSAGAVGTGAYWTLNFGRWTPFEFGVHLAVVKNGQIARAEIFPEDQQDTALARFAALTASLEADA